MKICIIGGSGFIGTDLAKKIKEKENDSFYIIDKNNSEYFPNVTKKIDIRSKNNLADQIDQNSIIINLAAEHKDNVRPVSLYHDVNVTGAHNICYAAVKNNITKIIFTSTCAVYGNTKKATDENGEISLKSEYAKSKYEAEQIYKSWQMESPNTRSLVIIRPTVVFGISNRGNVFNMFNQINKNRFFIIGNGKNHKSMAYIENVSSFIYHCLSLAPGCHVYNYVDKPDYSMNELYNEVSQSLKKIKIKIKIPFFIGIAVGKLFDLLSKISRKKFTISSVRVKKFCSNTIFDSSAHRTGFKPPFSLQDGLKKTIKKEFLNKPK